MRNIKPELRIKRLERASEFLLSSSLETEELGKNHILDLSYLPHNEKTIDGQSVYFLASSLLDKFVDSLSRENSAEKNIEHFVLPQSHGTILEWHVSDSQDHSIFIILLEDNGNFSTGIETNAYRETHVLNKNKDGVYIHKAFAENYEPLLGKRILYR